MEKEFESFKLEIQQQINDLKSLVINSRVVCDKWIGPAEACRLLGVKRRKLPELRIHLKDGAMVGLIGWRKSQGKNVQYYKPDIEKYLTQKKV